MFPPNSMGFYDVYGNVWEWTEDQFNGLPGFKTHYLYDDFSSPCFDGRHTMMTVSSLQKAPLYACIYVHVCILVAIHLQMLVMVAVRRLSEVCTKYKVKR